jgi:hypothetical protein
MGTERYPCPEPRMHIHRMRARRLSRMRLKDGWVGEASYEARVERLLASHGMVHLFDRSDAVGRHPRDPWHCPAHPRNRVPHRASRSACLAAVRLQGGRPWADQLIAHKQKGHRRGHGKCPTGWFKDPSARCVHLALALAGLWWKCYTHCFRQAADAAGTFAQHRPPSFPIAQQWCNARVAKSSFDG